jgi:hypothetical protein
MKLLQGIAADESVEAKAAFRVMMAYDDFTSGKRAMAICNFLACQLGGGVELRSSMWKFDVLRSARLNQIALDEAAEADVIIVANARSAGLPEQVQKWVAEWVPRKRGQAAALVALVDFTGEDKDQSALTYAFLKGAAIDAQIDFLAQEIRFTGSQMPPVSDVPPRKRPASAVDPSTDRPGFEGWGIND